MFVMSQVCRPYLEKRYIRPYYINIAYSLFTTLHNLRYIHTYIYLKPSVLPYSSFCTDPVQIFNTLQAFYTVSYVGGGDGGCKRALRERPSVKAVWMLSGVQQFIYQCLNTHTHSGAKCMAFCSIALQAGISQINTRVQPYLPPLPLHFQTVLSLAGRMDKYTHTHIVFRRSRALDFNKRPPHSFPFKSLSLPPSLYHYPLSPPPNLWCMYSRSRHGKRCVSDHQLQRKGRELSSITIYNP